jgi:hypothetical protein
MNSLYLLLVVIYRVKFYLLSYVLFSQILKNNGIDFRTAYCFLMILFLGINHTPMAKELSSIKNYCHYGKGIEGDCD